MKRKGCAGYFSFENKDDPNYKPHYGSEYTPRQIDILSGKILAKDIRLNELSILYRKAEQIGDIEAYEAAKSMYDRMLNPCEYEPTYTVEEAQAILQKLTPWVIEWE